MAGHSKQTLRIIGGEWRGRKFQFPAVEHLRPTPDRVRETLFNWLMPVISGSHCLDLFCGSGALGLEALSRGAAEVSFVDKNRQAIDALRTTCEVVQTDRAKLFCDTAQRFLKHSTDAYDVVFLDPPYDFEVINGIAEQLQQGHHLRPGAYIYIEHGGDFDRRSLPENWELYRDKSAGQVHYSLYKALA